MFSLLIKYADGRAKFLSPSISGKLAMLLGRRWSENINETVVAVESLPNGSSRECCRFEKGELVEQSSGSADSCAGDRGR